MAGRPFLLPHAKRRSLALLVLPKLQLEHDALCERFGITKSQLYSQIQQIKNAAKRLERKKSSVEKRRLKLTGMNENFIGSNMVRGMTVPEYAAWRKAARPGFDGLIFRPVLIRNFLNTLEGTHAKP